MNNQPHPHLRRSLLWLVALMGMWVFFRHGSSVWWDVPTMEFAPYYAGTLQADDPHGACLASAEQPGFLFARAIRQLQVWSGEDWYDLVYGLAALSAALLPVLLLAWLWQAWQVQHSGGLLTAFAAVVLVLAPPVRDFFTIAYWPPLQPGGSAQTVATLLALLALVLAGRAHRVWQVGALVCLWALAGAVHPLATVIWFAAGILAQVAPVPRRWAPALYAVGPLFWLARHLVVQQGPLDGQALATYLAYTANQYQALPSRFATSLPHLPWQLPFAMVVGVATLVIGLLWWRGQRAVALRGLLLLGFYLLGWLLPLLFIAQSPQGWAVVLQPTRLFQLGYWLLAWGALGLAVRVVPLGARWGMVWAVLAVLTTALLADAGTLPILAAAAAVWAYYAFELHTHAALRRAYLLVWVVALPFTFWVGQRVHQMDSHYGQYLPHQHFHNWAQRYTKPQAVFLTYDGLVAPKDLYLITHRHSFLEPGIQTAPDCLQDQHARRQAIFGDSLLRQEAYGAGYATLTPQRVVALAADYPLHYVLVARNQMGRFAPHQPEFWEDSLFVVYNVDSLRKALQ